MAAERVEQAGSAKLLARRVSSLVGRGDRARDRLSATGMPYEYRFAPQNAPPISFAPTLYLPYSLDLFGRGIRKQACGNCERTNDPTINQALYLLTDGDVMQRVSAENGRVSKLKSNDDDRAVVEELYLAALSRLPTSEETAESLDYLRECESRDAWMEDLAWSLLNVREFIFNH
jgi:hypothetical protein